MDHPTSAPLTGRPIRRGATDNPCGRFERERREALSEETWCEPLPPLRTEVAFERPRRVLTSNRSPDVGFDRSINPYRGCEHGCVYCFARPSHSYLGLSPGLDFETRLTVKTGVDVALRSELSQRDYTPAPIAIGTNTDPYQPIETRHGVMQAILSVLDETRHPVSIVTKGALIRRDIGTLGRMGTNGLARAAISITTLDKSLARKLEPRAATPANRLRLITALAEAGCPVGVMVAPVIPGLSDHEIEAILKAARAAGAGFGIHVMLRLPPEVGPIFRAWLDEHVPERAGRVMARVREMHGGRDYDPRWFHRMTGSGPHAEMIRQRVRKARRRLGLAARGPDLRCDLFRPPTRAQHSVDARQLSLF